MNRHLTATAQIRQKKGQKAIEQAKEQVALVAVCRADQEAIVRQHGTILPNRLDQTSGFGTKATHNT